MLVHCPSCQAKLRIDDDDSMEKIECPKCDESFIPAKTKSSKPAPVPAKAVKASRRNDEDDDDFDDDEEDVRPTPRKKKKSAKKEKDEKKFPLLPVAIGGGLALIVIVGLVIYLVVGGDGEGGKQAKNPPANSKTGTPTSQTSPATTTPATKTEVVPPTVAPPATRPLITVPATRPSTPATRPATPSTRPSTPADPYADLFKEKITVQPPTIRAAKLQPLDENIQLDVPSFYSLRMAQNLPGARPLSKDSKLTHEECKAATVFINVDAGDEGGSGSGFLIGVLHGNAYIATNHHVIEAALARRRAVGTKPTITVVFNSNEMNESSHEVQIVAHDPISDLAILKFETQGKKMPKIIDPYQTPKISDFMKDIRVYGFPKGDLLKVEGAKYPAVTTTEVTVSALPKNAAGRIEHVQLSGGSVTHGNSGGPVVDKDGRLIGILSSGIANTQISFAIPVERLISLIEGRLLLTRFFSTGIEGNDAKFIAVLPVMDPFNNVREMYVRWWAGNGTPPTPVKDPKMGYKPIMGPNTAQAKLEMFGTNTALAYGLGEFRLPTQVEGVQMQIASVSNSNITSASSPVSYKLNVAEVVVPTDAQPFETLTGNPEAHVGKVLIIKARIIDPPARTRRTSNTLRIVSLEGQVAQNVRFLASKEFAPHFDEVLRDHQGLPCRITCLVGKKGSDDVFPVRVDRVDFIDNEFGSQEYVVQTIPSETQNPVFKLNRDPSQFLGQTIDVTTVMELRIDRKSLQPDGTIEIPILFPGRLHPRNLQFVVSKDMLEKIAEANMKPAEYRVKLKVKVADKPGDVSKPTRVTIQRITILDSEGKEVKTIE